MMYKKIFATLAAALLFVGVAALGGCGSNNVQDPDLVGFWAWNAAPNVYYAFFEDGTGYRTGTSEMVGDDWPGQFDWAIPREGRLDMFFWGAGRESWIYTIDGNRLEIVNRGDSDQAFGYNRVEESPLFTTPSPSANP